MRPGSVGYGPGVVSTDPRPMPVPQPADPWAELQRSFRAIRARLEVHERQAKELRAELDAAERAAAAARGAAVLEVNAAAGRALRMLQDGAR